MIMLGGLAGSFLDVGLSGMWISSLLDRPALKK